jgi:Family of unknown function (DUF5946)
MNILQQAYIDLSFYTLSLQDADFIHQHIAAAHTAQTAVTNTKPVSIVFALAGLLLHLEKGYTGREVQLFHQSMAAQKRQWPNIALPVERGAITVADVVKVLPGPERKAMITHWCASVWKAYHQNQGKIRELVNKYGV